MARRKSPTLTEVELELMDVLWDKGQATVSEIVESLLTRDWRQLGSDNDADIEQKEYVEHEKEGRVRLPPAGQPPAGAKERNRLSAQAFFQQFSRIARS